MLIAADVDKPIEVMIERIYTPDDIERSFKGLYRIPLSLVPNKRLGLNK